MSSSSRRAVLLSLTALAGCGFRPAYGPGGGAEELRGRIAVAAPADEEGFALVEQLEKRLGQPAAADLALTAGIYISEQALGFLPDGSISRYNVTGEVAWTLTGASGPVLTGRERAFTSYSATSTTVASGATAKCEPS